jgi:hypothetical protein
MDLKKITKHMMPDTINIDPMSMVFSFLRKQADNTRVRILK